jgi:hypothetical protein
MPYPKEFVRRLNEAGQTQERIKDYLESVLADAVDWIYENGEDGVDVWFSLRILESSNSEGEEDAFDQSS